MREGSRGPEYAVFALRRVVASREGLLGPDLWLMLRGPQAVAARARARRRLAEHSP